MHKQLKKIKDNISSLSKKVANHLFVDSYNCIICDRELAKTNRYAMCIRCSAKLAMIKNSCEKCGKPLNMHTNYCLNCQNHTRHFTRTYSVFEYFGDIEKLVYGLKFGNKRYLAKYLASFLVDNIIDNNIIAEVVIAVPLHKNRQKERGYNQAELLAQCVCEKLNLPMSKGLKRIRATEMQAKSSAKNRQKNVEDAFKACERFDNKRIFLIDDVLTTGATMSEAAKALKKAGAIEVIGLTLCNVRDKLIEPVDYLEV